MKASDMLSSASSSLASTSQTAVRTLTPTPVAASDTSVQLQPPTVRRGRQSQEVVTVTAVPAPPKAQEAHQSKSDATPDVSAAVRATLAKASRKKAEAAEKAAAAEERYDLAQRPVPARSSDRAFWRLRLA